MGDKNDPCVGYDVDKHLCCRTKYQSSGVQSSWVLKSQMKMVLEVKLQVPVTAVGMKNERLGAKWNTVSSHL